MEHLQYLTDALSENKSGKLSAAQIMVLTKMMNARGVTAWILIICGLVVAIPTAIGLFALDSAQGDQTAFWIMLSLLIVFIVFVVYGFKMRASKNKGMQNLSSLPVEKHTGKPEKYDFTTPIRAPIPGQGGTFLMFLRVKAGLVKLNGTKFGVIPGPLYSVIDDTKEGTFYSIPLSGVGFKDHVIVNYVE